MLTHMIRQSSDDTLRVLIAATASLLVAGCGSTSNGGGPGDDADAGTDSSTGDAATVDSGSGMAPQPLLQGHYTIESGMADGHFLVRDQAGAASAVDEATGAAQAIVAGATRFRGFDKVAFVWSNANASLHLWTAAGGTRQIASAAFRTVAASADGVYVAYYDNFQNNLADLYLNRTDVDEPHKLLSGTRVGSACSPQLGFVAGRLIASHCEGVDVATVTSWNLADQSHLDLLATGYSAWTFDRAETRIFVLDLDNKGWVVTPTDATPVLIGSDIQRAQFTADGKAILYRTGARGLFREAAGGGTPTTLQASGVGGLYGASPDTRTVLFTSGLDAQGLLSDLKLTSAIQNDAVTTLNAAQTSGFMGAFFTTDSRYALYGQGIDPTYFIGSMYAVPTGGGAPRLVAAGVNVWYAIGAAKLVFDDHFTPGGAQGTADIESLDLDVAGATPRRLATQVNGLFLVTRDNRAVIYAAETGPSGAGVYRLALP